jgi:peptidoglycan/xylan/chitin deacetylase (PgdA/CDA1 family)
VFSANDWIFTSMIAITIDLDWAPDKGIQFTFDLLREYDIQATVFCTHDHDQVLVFMKAIR